VLIRIALQINLGVPVTEIAIITPYQAQVAHISALLRVDYPDLIIGSVDGMQGQEREVSWVMAARSAD
jgi:DNA polymerase alpha-associated DNA helicase A